MPGHALPEVGRVWDMQNNSGRGLNAKQEGAKGRVEGPCLLAPGPSADVRFIMAWLVRGNVLESWRPISNKSALGLVLADEGGQDFGNVGPKILSCPSGQSKAIDKVLKRLLL